MTPATGIFVIMPSTTIRGPPTTGRPLLSPRPDPLQGLATRAMHPQMPRRSWALREGFQNGARPGFAARPDDRGPAWVRQPEPEGRPPEQVIRPGRPSH